MALSSTTRMVSLPAAVARGPTVGAAPTCGAPTREEKPDRGALFRAGAYLHRAAGLLDEAIDHAQAEAGALAHLLGGEERLEGAAGDLGRHAGAGIASPRS